MDENKELLNYSLVRHFFYNMQCLFSQCLGVLSILILLLTELSIGLIVQQGSRSPIIFGSRETQIGSTTHILRIFGLIIFFLAEVGKTYVACYVNRCWLYKTLLEKCEGGGFCEILPISNRNFGVSKVSDSSTDNWERNRSSVTLRSPQDIVKYLKSSETEYFATHRLFMLCCFVYNIGFIFMYLADPNP